LLMEVLSYPNPNPNAGPLDASCPNSLTWTTGMALAQEAPIRGIIIAGLQVHV